MTPIRRDVACAVCGLVACAHLTVLDAAHSHSYETQPIVLSEGLPTEPDHTHDDFERSVLIELSNVTVSGTSTDMPPGQWADPSALLFRARERQRRHPAYFGWTFSAPPPLLATTS